MDRKELSRLLRPLKRRYPKKYIRAKYVLYFFPEVRKSPQRINVLLKNLDNHYVSIRCDSFEEVPIFCYGFTVSCANGLYFVHLEDFFKHFNI